MLKKTLFISYLFVGVTTWAQDKANEFAEVNDSTLVADNDVISFEKYYYDALNEKIKGNHREAVELLRLALRFKPNNADAQFEISINYKSLKDYRKAILFGENAVRFNPSQKWYWLNVSELYSLVGDAKNAERCYGELSKLEPRFIPEYIKSVARTGETAVALRKVDIFLKNSRTEELLVLKRDLLVVNGMPDEAIDLTKELIELSPEIPDYYYEISELLLKNDRVDEAEQYIMDGLKVIPDSPILVRQDFKILMQKSDYDAAFVILNEAFVNPRMDFNEKLGFVIDFVDSDKEHKQTARLINSLEDWVADTHEVKIYPIIGNLYKIEGNNEKSLEAFRLGFSKGHTEFTSLIEMLILEQDLGKYDLLLSDSDKMLEIYPSHPVLYLFKGFAANQTGDFKYSIEALELGLDYVVNNNRLKAEFYSMIADSYYRIEEFDKSFNAFDEAIALDPENIVALNNYSYFLAENSTQLDKALKMITQVLEVEPDNTTYLDTKAWVYYKQGEYEKARGILKQALNAGGELSADILEHYGDILFKLDKVNQAVKQWEKAYKLASNSTSLKEKINNRALIE